jgi:L-fuculokinase
MPDALIVLDIGKTNAKLTLIDAAGNVLDEQRRPNVVRTDGPYPSLDTEAVWDWILGACRRFARLAQVGAIVPVTHGATAALVDGDGLVLPVLDYEAVLAGIDYAALRPAYAETYSPALPAGLNLGRQLAWLAHHFPADFARAEHILMYPQYWAWRLSGAIAAEATSLGCHTDLWNPLAQRHSSLVERMGWQRLMPPVVAPSAVLGTLRADVAHATGLPARCEVLCGIHDSNASLLRHLGGGAGQPGRTVLSTGTWTIAAVFGTALEHLRERDDMLANTNAFGEAVACMRFMGGREFATLAGPEIVPCTSAHLEALAGRGTLALPCFADAGGPFAGRRGAVDGPAPRDAQERYALATLYCVLMTDYCLDALGSSGPIAVEGSYTANRHFGGLLAGLRPRQTVTYSEDASGTTCGGWMLRHPTTPLARAAQDAVQQPTLDLTGYRQRWRDALGIRAAAA